MTDWSVCCLFLFFQAAVPFAVVGCNTVVEAGGKKIRGRAYPWGIVESECLILLLEIL
jgi:hypothetical protein